MDIVKEVGLPAMLEQCAEECAELSHACLKLSRWMRDENPTPADVESMEVALAEEMADTYLCIHELAKHFNTVRVILDIRNEKLERWERRLEAHKKGEIYD